MQAGYMQAVGRCRHVQSISLHQVSDPVMQTCLHASNYPGLSHPAHMNQTQAFPNCSSLARNIELQLFHVIMSAQPAVLFHQLQFN